jgi:integrase
MPKLRYSVPKYCRHKPSGQARVYINGKDHLLGPYGSEESRQKYKRLISQYLDRREDREAGLTVSQVCAHFWRHAKRRYGSKGKGKFGAAVSWRPVLRMLRVNYGKTPAIEFGPKALKTVRDHMIAAGWSRTYINDQINRGRRAFKWAASEELIPAEVYQRLTTVEGLRIGQSEAVEAEPVEPVADELVNVTIPHMKPHIAAMVQLQRLCGCRPGELCAMQVEDVDRHGEVWVFRPQHHKTEHHGKRREIYIGPKGQTILAPYLMKAGDGYVFKTRRYRPYNTDTYRRAIHRACDTGKLERWSPNQLRHARGTEVRDTFGLEHAQAALGHASANMTEHYAAVGRQRGLEVAERLG